VTTLTFATVAVVLYGILGRKGYGRALALGGSTVAGAAVVVGTTAVPTFYAVAIGAAVAVALRVLHRRPGSLPAGESLPPGVPLLLAFLGWSVFVTLMAPQLFDGLPARCDEIGHVSWSRVDQATLVIRCTSALDGPDRLMVIDLNGTVLRMLDDQHTRLDDPVISPDGRSVAYWAADGSGRPGGGGIYVRDIAGTTQPQRLTRDVAGRDADPAWSPDGDSIAFRRRSGENLDVYAMDSDGGDEHRVVGGPAEDEKPLYSPDGRQLMVVSNRTADGQPGDTDDVYLVDVDGGTLKPLGLEAATISTPVWSNR